MDDDKTDKTPKKREEFGPRKRAVFLDNLRKYGSVYFAAKQSGVSRGHVYTVREADPEFAAAWDQAKEDALDLLEASAAKRAHTTSDTLLIFLLKAGRPKTYREPVQRYAETDTEGNDKNTLTDDQLLDRAQAIIKAREDRPS